MTNASNEHHGNVEGTIADDDLTVITAVEGTPAADLAAAIELLAAGSVLVDFGSDADVTLVFGSPAALPGTSTPAHSA